MSCKLDEIDKDRYASCPDSLQMFEEYSIGDKRPVESKEESPSKRKKL